VKSYPEFCEDHIDAIYVTEAASASPAGQTAACRAEAVWPGRVEPVESRGAVPRHHQNQRTVVIDEVRGEPFGHCPGSNGHLCCNYHTVDLYIGCSIGCTYCIMNGYLNFAPLVVQADTRSVITAIRAAAESHPDRPLRVGSGEVGDSLLLDPVFHLNEEIIRGVADLPNVRYEAKTKTDYVDHLLEIEPKGNAVIAFSLNPDPIVAGEEGIAASPGERLDAAHRCVAAGYQVAFHFDPIIRTNAFPDDYLGLIAELGAFPAGAIAWISMGTIRFPPALKDVFATRPFAGEEFVPTRDGKLRYLQPVRRGIYATLRSAFAEATAAPVYMCMESPAMWNRVYGDRPERVPELRGIFSPSSQIQSTESTRRSP
jgi:DNA repair photolyase